jgi:hypothetical protein
MIVLFLKSYENRSKLKPAKKHVPFLNLFAKKDEAEPNNIIINTLSFENLFSLSFSQSVSECQNYFINMTVPMGMTMCIKTSKPRVGETRSTTRL